MAFKRGYRKKRAYRRKRPKRDFKMGRYKRVRRGYNVKTPITRVLNGVPERLFTKLRYVDTVAFTTATPNLLNVPFYFQSSLYAPRNTGGHQPLYFDQWCNMFSKYRVYGIAYHFTCCNRGYNEPFWFGVRNQDNASYETSLQTLMERNDSKMRMASSVNSGNNTVVIKGYCSVASCIGVTRSAIKNDDKYSALINASPAEMAYVVPYYTQILAAGSATTDFTFRLTYYCEFYNQTSVVAS